MAQFTETAELRNLNAEKPASRVIGVLLAIRMERRGAGFEDHPEDHWGQCARYLCFFWYGTDGVIM
jgi:hypothetical protein